MRNLRLSHFICAATLACTFPALGSRVVTVNQVSNCAEFTDLGTSLVVLHNLSKVDQNVSIKGGMKYLVGNDTTWGPRLGLTVGNYMAGCGHDSNVTVTSNGQPRTYPTGFSC